MKMHVKSMEILGKSKGIHGNPWSSRNSWNKKVHGNLWKSMEIERNSWEIHGIKLEVHINTWKSMEINGNPWKTMEMYRKGRGGGGVGGTKTNRGDGCRRLTF